MKHECVKIDLICFRDVIEVSETVAKLTELNGLNVSSGDIGHVSQCWAREQLSPGQRRVKTAQEPQVLLVSFFKQGKMPNTPDHCDDGMHSNLFSICSTLTPHLYLFFMFFFFFQTAAGGSRFPVLSQLKRMWLIRLEANKDGWVRFQS